MDALFPHVVAAVVLAVIGAAGGVVLARFAAARTVAQPLALALDDEVRLLVGVLSDIRLLPYLTALTPEDFAAGADGRIWGGLLAAGREELSSLGEDPTEEQCSAAGAQLAERADGFHARLHAALGSSPTGRQDLSRLAELAARSSTLRLSDSEVVEAGQAVLLTGTGRSTLAGNGLVLPTSTPDSVDPRRPPLARVLVKPSAARLVVTAAATSVAMAMSWGLLSGAGFAGASLWVALAAYAALVGASVVISLVDFDTFYVDLRTFLLAGGATWVLTIVAVAVLGAWTRAVSGLVVVAATGVLFELLNRGFRAARGFDAQGFGDTLLIVLTAGVPAALSGDWVLGGYATLVGMVSAVLGWAAGRVTGRVAGGAPLALGPYLSVGWVAAWGLAAAGVM